MNGKTKTRPQESVSGLWSKDKYQTRTHKHPIFLSQAHLIILGISWGGYYGLDSPLLDILTVLRCINPSLCMRTCEVSPRQQHDPLSEFHSLTMHLADWKHTAQACSSLSAAPNDCRIAESRTQRLPSRAQREKSLQSPAMFAFSLLLQWSGRTCELSWLDGRIVIGESFGQQRALRDVWGDFWMGFCGKWFSLRCF